MLDFNSIRELYNTASAVGWPLIFVMAQLRGVVFVRPHVDMIIARVADLTIEVKEANSRADRSLSVAESANEIAAQALAVSEATQQAIEAHTDLLRQLQLHFDVGQISGRVQGGS